MNNPLAVRSNIFAENLADETILYDKTRHKAHSLNKTVTMVWESADGKKSVSEIAGILQRELGIPEDRGVVLLALEELQSAGLVEFQAELIESPERPSRREVARRLVLAGASAALVPVVASVLAPTPARASSTASVTLKQFQADLQTVDIDIGTHGIAYARSQTAQNDFNAGVAAGNQGVVDTLLGNHTGAQTEFSVAQSDFDGVLAALGLPPL
jgi:Coenzyme PQQ synthesis protein D (PqqD)